MSKNKHTPGPWNTSKNKAGTWEIKPVGAIHSVASTCPAPSMGYLPGDEEANAHLIATAPDLLAMIIRVRKHGGIEKLSQFDELETLIAKAKGEAQ